jgi:hypothetical protein
MQPLTNGIMASHPHLDGLASPLPVHPPPVLTSPAPAIGQMLPHKRPPEPLPFPLTAAYNPQSFAPIASTSSVPNTPQASAQPPLNTTFIALNDPRKPLPLIPTDRLAAPMSRPAEDEAAAKEFVSNALKEARQYSGSRPSPLTQIDRLIARVRLFCHLHAQGHFGDRNITIYWSDLLKFGGMGTVSRP